MFHLVREHHQIRIMQKVLLHLHPSPLSLRSLEKVLGWSVHIISIRGENGNEMRSRVTKINAKTYISFIAVDTDGVAIGAQKVHE